MNETHEKAYKQIRLHLETRLARVLSIERTALPPLSLSEIMSLLFIMFGHSNSLGASSETASAIVALVGDAFWTKPETAESTSVN
jgi:hypothetical protein